MMRRWIRLVGGLALSLLIFAGCATSSGTVVDDFSDPASGWGASSHETYVRGYQQGQYLFQIDVPNWFVWVTGGYRYKDVAIRVTTRSQQETDNHFGVLCRYSEGSFYYFAISSDGYYGIFRRLNGGSLEPLSGQAMLRSPLVRTGNAENQLTAVCRGTTLTLYVNGEQVARVEDDALTQGDIGMATGTLTEGGTIVWFDDLEAREP